MTITDTPLGSDEKKKEKVQFSIHPRMQFAPNMRKKKNTCANSSLGRRLSLAIVGTTKHLVSHPQDAACFQRLANAKSRLNDL